MSSTPESLSLGLRWHPNPGSETRALLEKFLKNESERTHVENSAIRILGKSVPPSEREGTETGLVVGYVQSGKTLSFTTITALAKDNFYPIIIVLAGTSNNLLDQSTERLCDDLNINGTGPRRWLQLTEPPENPSDLDIIRNILLDWQDSDVPNEEKETVLITVKKHWGRLGYLTEMMSQLNLNGVPVLIVDDEADQASLNTEVNQGDESTTYRRILALRDCLPHHTYIQYTATPQAPLLINIIDSLSPNFVEVLEPGVDYVGGREFFADGEPYICEIPPAQIPSNNNPLTDPPESLIEALQIYVVGVVAGLINTGGSGNRSMLVHPSHLRGRHQEFTSWVREIINNWRRVLDLPEADLDRMQLIEEFQNAYDDLHHTVEDLPDYQDIARQLKRAFRNINILEVNARQGQTPKVPWGRRYGWILIGGQSMDRGFTVNGLTVTYMPRGIGGGNADTVQQRARFFGYKRRYLGYCRVYLDRTTLQFYREYVQHEEMMRNSLIEHQDSGLDLDGWKRAFILSPAMKPTRDCVLNLNYSRGNFSSRWFIPKVILQSIHNLQQNRQAVLGFLSRFSLTEDMGHPSRTALHKHQYVDDVPLMLVVEELLLHLRLSGTTDSEKNTGLLLQLSKALEENPEESCRLYRMSPDADRTRTVNAENGEITYLFQGASPVNPSHLRGSIYPGDSEIRDSENVTVQIHFLKLKDENNIEIATDVPVVAVWVPQRLAASWYVQEEQ